MEVFCPGARSGHEAVVGGVPAAGNVPEGCLTRPGVTVLLLSSQEPGPRLAPSPALGEMLRSWESGCSAHKNLLGASFRNVKPLQSVPLGKARVGGPSVRGCFGGA